jgi:hypothetical protein
MTALSRDLDGSNGLHDAAWANEGQTITVYEDDMDPDDFGPESSGVGHGHPERVHDGEHVGNCSYNFGFEFVDI